MAPVAKVSEFRKEGDDWFCSTGLASDIIVVVEGVKFHLHKFPLMSKCGKMSKLYEESQSSHKKTLTTVLEDFPGGPETFLVAAKFCYGARIELAPRNIVLVYCAADYLEMTEAYEEGNLLSRAETFLHKHVYRNWKDCILALQSSDPVLLAAEKLLVLSKCLNAVSTMVCTDPSLFGWPMRMYGSLQSPGGSILWNGINTGAKIRSSESGWWYEDISYLSVDLFERLIRTMRSRGIRDENLVGAIIHYARKYLPGLGRWQSGQQGGRSRTVASFSLKPASVDQKRLLETVINLLPEKKGRSFCRFLLGLLRVAFILGADQDCLDSLERKIGLQLELATLDGLLILNYSDSEIFYNVDCVERIISHFQSIESKLSSFSPPSWDPEPSPASISARKVGKLVDSYIAEVAPDANLKPEKLRSLAVALPESSRPLHDGLYRALDIYFKEHPWLSDTEKEQLCHIIDFQRLSIDACAHASQNQRLPLRIVLQALFFEQMHLRSALAGCLHVANTETAAPAGTRVAAAEPMNNRAGQIVQRDGWVTVVRENQVLKVDMERMRSRVGELEEEFGRIKQEMKRVSKSHSSLSSPRVVPKKMGCRFLSRTSNAQEDDARSGCHTRRASTSRHSRHRKSLSIL